MKPELLANHGAKIRWASIALIAIALVVIARSLPLDEAVERAGEWVDSLGAAGPAVFGLLYVVAVLALVPGALLTLAAGALFGIGLGLLVVSLSATAGATLAFVIARHVARERVERVAQRRPKFAAVDEAIEQEGAKMIALLRLSPLLPFSVSNYLYGLTGVSLRGYVVATWLGTLPGTVMYVYLGHVGGAGLAGGGGERTTGEWVLLGVGLAATVAVTVYLTIVAKKKVKERAAGEDERAESRSPSEREAGPGKTIALAAAALVLAAVAVGCALKPDVLAGWLGA